METMMLMMLSFDPNPNHEADVPPVYGDQANASSADANSRTADYGASNPAPAGRHLTPVLRSNAETSHKVNENLPLLLKIKRSLPQSAILPLFLNNWFTY